ncbi:MAG: 4-amino-4-deoxy-L-arabinose transferase-like glycosyltransferase [Glaciecola sp.]|jgi:4-amino-4-deoxy-L-arabinose transferase-like glycosyltransferase
MLNKIHPIWFLIAGILLFRLVSLSLYPLIDTTEARYGEMARIMWETQNWITPQFDYNVPFWGKPPLHTWASAAFGGILGISEFSLRLPHFLIGMITLFVMGVFAKRFSLSSSLVILVLASTLGFFVASGMIMTDAFLLLGMTMAMAGFAIAWRDDSNSYAYFGFVGIGIGLLAKGPIIIVLIGLAVAPWLVLNYGLITGIKTFYRKIPLFKGCLLTLAISLPWYLLAETKTPGFLNYFIIGEHFLRFVQSGWEGDLYGTAHSEPRGIIWIYWIAVAFPWSIYFAVLLVIKKHRTALGQHGFNFYLPSYLMCWLISPMLLFTMSGNILPIYVLPGIPALSLLIAIMVKHIRFSVVITSLLTPILMVFFMVVQLPNLANEKSDKALLAYIESEFDLYYLGTRSFSGRFYSSGRAIKLESLEELRKIDTPFYLVLDRKTLSVQEGFANCETISHNKRRALLLCA